jgi:hypothetical protein
MGQVVHGATAEMCVFLEAGWHESVRQRIAKKREKTAHKFVVFAANPVSLKIRA